MRILSINLILVSLLSLISISIAKVIVYSPKELKDAVVRKKGNTDGFNVSLANFGVIPYGHSIIGRIYFDPENADGCEPFGEFDYSKDPDDNEHPTPIILVERGNCTFVKKVRNIQHAGGRLGIVMDNKVEDITSVIMSDDGTGMGIMIPSLLIGRGDGQILKTFLEDHGGTHYFKKKTNDTKEEGIEDEDEDDKKSKKSKKKKEEKSRDQELVEQAALLVSFEMPHPDQRVEYDIWYSSIDDRALDFITDFQKYDEKLGDLALMTPHFVSWKCTECDADFKRNECFADGKYCAVIHDTIKLPGREILLEDLRQRCIYQKHPTNHRSVFWDYVREVHQSCPGYINEDCSRSIHSKLKLDYSETMRCVNNTFDRGDYNDARQDNFGLAEERKYWNEYGAHFYPSIVINNRTYRGTFEPEAVFNSICAGFKTPPKICQQAAGGSESIVKGINGTTIVYIVLGLILLNVVLIYCYRRISQREMKEDMRMHVNSAVSQYFALSQRDRDTA